MKVKKLIGDKAFYKNVLMIAIPIMLQNGITNFVNMLDNIMVGLIGTEQMSGVSIVNQLVFIFNLCIFGALSGAGIFTAQYFGQKNTEGVRDTFRIKFIMGTVLTVLAIVFLYFYCPNLISLYLHEGSKDGSLADTLHYGTMYMRVTLIGLIPFMLEQCYSSTLRETGETVVPMRASIVAVFLNLVLNYILIYGKLGMPEMGVVGAALATVISRFVQVTIVVVWTHRHADINTFIVGAYNNLKVSAMLWKKIIITGFPLLINETLWAAGVAAQVQCYSIRGLSVVAALNINSTIVNVFNIAFIALGDSVAIIVGQILGSNDTKRAKESAYKIIAMSVCTCFVVGSLLFLFAPIFPRIYNTSDEVKSIAENLIKISACIMPVQGFLHATYFTMRSGGKTVITFLFDSVFLWVIALPFAFILSRYTGLTIITVFLLVQLADLIKAVIGWAILKSGVWMQVIV